MSPRKVLSRVAAASAVGAAAVTLGFAVPAHAEGAVDVSINRLASGITAGERPEAFAVRMQNRTKVEIQPIRRTFSIRLAGLSAAAVRITRGLEPLPASGTDDVHVTDTLNVRLGPEGRAGGELNTPYTIQFTEAAPAGKATLTVVASIGDNVLGSDSQGITVRGGKGATPTKSPVATGAGVVPTFETPSAESIAPLTEDKGLAGSEGGIPFAFYVVGALLVGAGGVILWLLFRPRLGLAGAKAVDHEPTPPPGRTAPRHAAPEHPTAAFPTVPMDPHSPPRAFDPWAGPPDPPDPTKEFRPHR